MFILLKFEVLQGVTDVSALGHIQFLDLRGCDGVRDVSALGHVHMLRWIYS